jgi:hypothetical protein
MHQKLSSKDGLQNMYGWVLLEGTAGNSLKDNYRTATEGPKTNDE